MKICNFCIRLDFQPDHRWAKKPNTRWYFATMCLQPALIWEVANTQSFKNPTRLNLMASLPSEITSADNLTPRISPSLTIQQSLLREGFSFARNAGSFQASRTGGGGAPILFWEAFLWVAFAPYLNFDSCAWIFLPPQILPQAISTALFASWMDPNLTKAKPFFFPLRLSMGMKKSKILTALQNMASKSVLEVSSAILETNKVKDFSLRWRILRGREGILS